MSNNESNETKKGVSRRKYLKMLGATAGAVAGLNVSTAPGIAQRGEAIYSGTAETVVLAGDGASVTQHNYQRNVVIVFGQPRRGGSQETNPFNLFVGPADRNETGQPGHFEIHSATLVDGNLFQFWELQRQDNNTFVGTLTNPSNAEALVWNLINVELPLIPGRPNLGVFTHVKGMGAGTQLAGGVNDSTAELRLLGATIDQFTQFGSRVLASRVA